MSSVTEKKHQLPTTAPESKKRKLESSPNPHESSKKMVKVSKS